MLLYRISPEIYHILRTKLKWFPNKEINERTHFNHSTYLMVTHPLLYNYWSTTRRYTCTISIHYMSVYILKKSLDSNTNLGFAIVKNKM